MAPPQKKLCAHAFLIGFVFLFGGPVHGLGAELEFDASVVDAGDDVNALVTGGFWGGDVIFEGAWNDVVMVAQFAEASVDVEFVLDDDSHAVEVVELFDGFMLSSGFFGGALGGFDAVVDGGVSDAAAFEPLGDVFGLRVEPSGVGAVPGFKEAWGRGAGEILAGEGTARGCGVKDVRVEEGERHEEERYNDEAAFVEISCKSGDLLG